MVNLFFKKKQSHKRFTKISIEILAQSPLYRKDPSYWQTTYVFLLIIIQSRLNHPESQFSSTLIDTIIIFLISK
jgi:hypothetical protein